MDLCLLVNPKNFQRFIICSFNIYSEIKKTLVHFMTFGRLILEYQLLYLKPIVIFIEILVNYNRPILLKILRVMVHVQI